MLEARIIVTPGIGALLTEKGHNIIFWDDGNVLYPHLYCSQMQNSNICIL